MIHLNYLFAVKSDIIQFRIIVIVINYTDISRNMKYNRNRQFGRLIETTISLYVQDNANGKLAVYSTARPRVLVA